MYDKHTILDDFDDCNVYKMWPILKDDILTISDSRIHLYASEDKWAVVFEVDGYAISSGHIEVTLYYFGDYFPFAKVKGNNLNFEVLAITEGDQMDNLTVELPNHGGFVVRKDVASILVRGKEIPIERNLEVYRENRVPLAEFPKPYEEDLYEDSVVRLMTIQYPDVFHATETEIRSHLPKGIPKLMEIRDWHHIDYFEPEPRNLGVRPSNCETFQMVADILVSKDTTRWQPTLPPNNYWKYSGFFD